MSGPVIELPRCPKCGDQLTPTYHGRVPCQQGCPAPWQAYPKGEKATGTEHLRWHCPRCGYGSRTGDDDISSIGRYARRAL